MAYHPEAMREAREKYREAVRVFNEKEERKKESLLTKSPSLRECSRELDRLSLRMARSALMGLPGEISKIRKEAEEIYLKQAKILVEIGEAQDALRPHYMCAKCEDSGSTGNGDCECLLSFYRKEMLKRYQLYLGDGSFDAIRLELFTGAYNVDGVSPRIQIEYATEACLRYAEAFTEEQGGGLYFHGPCGVGKSFLASAVARRVIERGFYVHCVSAIEIFPIYDRSRFGRCDENEKAMLEACFDADLLFLDDLGGEVVSAQNAPFLARLLNERLNQKKGTILVSQYTSEELVRRYSSQVYSRVAGNLEDIYLFGNDLRSNMPN